MCLLATNLLPRTAVCTETGRARGRTLPGRQGGPPWRKSLVLAKTAGEAASHILITRDLIHFKCVPSVPEGARSLCHWTLPGHAAQQPRCQQGGV